MNFKKILGSIAPFLGTMIGGPFGAAAGALVGKVLLNDQDASDDDIAVALGKATPEQLVELKKVDAEYKTKMAQLGLDEQKIAQLDRASARKREVKTKDKIPSILALLLTGGFFGIMGVMMFFPIPDTAIQVIDVMLGSLGTAWISVITYYFGSSYGSRIKTHLLGKE